MKLFKGTFFEFEYPDEWEFEIIEHIPCFFDPEGSGALQTAAFRDPEGEPFDVLDELAAYLDRQEISVNADRIATFDLPFGAHAAGCEFMKDDRFWLVNCIVEKDKMVLLIWNSDDLPDRDTATAIGHSVMTMKFRN